MEATPIRHKNNTIIIAPPVLPFNKLTKLAQTLFVCTTEGGREGEREGERKRRREG